MSFDPWNRAIALYRNGFVRNVVVLQTGSFLGTFIQALAGVVLARVLQPERFGIYTLAFGMAALTSVFLGAGVQDAVATIASRAYARASREEAHHAFGFLLKISFYTSAVAFLVALSMPWIARWWYGDATIGVYGAWVVGASIISTTFLAGATIALQVVGKIRQMTVLLSVDQIIRFTCSVLLVVSGFGIAGAVAGQVIGALVLMVAAGIVWRNVAANDPLIPSPVGVLRTLSTTPIRQHLGFSLWVALDRNFSVFYTFLPIILLGVFVDSRSEVSYFKLAFGFMNIALSLLGPVSTLLNVEFPKIQVDRPEDLFRNFIRVTFFGLGLSLVLAVAAVIVSPFAFRILYGHSFSDAVPYVFGLLPYGVLFGIGVGLGPMWRAIDKVTTSLTISAVTLAVCFPIGLVLMQRYTLWGAVMTVTLWYTATHVASLIVLVKNIRRLSSG